MDWNTDLTQRFEKEQQAQCEYNENLLQGVKGMEMNNIQNKQCTTPAHISSPAELAVKTLREEVDAAELLYCEMCDILEPVAFQQPPEEAIGQEETIPAIPSLFNEIRILTARLHQIHSDMRNKIRSTGL